MTFVNWIAEALLIHISIPPKCSTDLFIASLTLSSLRISQIIGNASPPASIISSAAVYIVPGNFGCGSAVLAATTIFAPSTAAFFAIARPIPLLPPEIKITFSFKLIFLPLS